MKTTIRRQRSQRGQVSKATDLEHQVLTHKGWKGDISLPEAAQMLEGSSPFTFVLSKGFDKYHYILSFVSETDVVKHKNIRILIFKGQTCFMNGGNRGPSIDIDDLIRGCLNCSSSICKPL